MAFSGSSEARNGVGRAMGDFPMTTPAGAINLIMVQDIGVGRRLGLQEWFVASDAVGLNDVLSVVRRANDLRVGVGGEDVSVATTIHGFGGVASEEVFLWDMAISALSNASMRAFCPGIVGTQHHVAIGTCF